MIAFLDFEASSLGRHGFPIEIAWVFESGEEEAHLIRPAEDWTEWDAAAQAVHGIPREALERQGMPVPELGQRMLRVLAGHRLYASAPSWDGQWLSRLLRAAGLPRHALRLRDTDEAQAEVASAILQAAGLPPEERQRLQTRILEDARNMPGHPVHRALDDARRERALWLEVRRQAEAAAAQRHPGR
ncbi:MAG: transcriptional regulator [Acetobacteraceae bacterium]|nr:transcriptional regulator [Acetobacteraceae bacterium]